jgi:hypothetical protein
MDKSALMEMALEKLVGDMDDLEGSAAMSHSAEDCPDPLGCKEHDSEHADNLSGEGKPEGGVEVEIKKIGGMPSMEGAKAEDEEEGAEHEPKAEGLSDEEAEELRKLLK